MNTFEMLREFSYAVLSGQGLSEAQYKLLDQAEDELQLQIGQLQERLAVIDSIRKLNPNIKFYVEA